MSDCLYEACKYKGKWAIYDPVSCTYDYIGAGKRKCVEAAKRLNATLTPEDIKAYRDIMLRRALED